MSVNWSGASSSTLVRADHNSGLVFANYGNADFAWRATLIAGYALYHERVVRGGVGPGAVAVSG